MTNFIYIVLGTAFGIVLTKSEVIRLVPDQENVSAGRTLYVSDHRFGGFNRNNFCVHP